MKLSFLGATGTVTGSKYLLQTEQGNLLIDCGLFQGLKALRLRNWLPLPVVLRDVHAVLLTHAHIDHSGYLPVLARNGFRGPVYCTPATRDLCEIMLPDSARLLEEEAQYANRHHFSRHQPALPLYTEADAQRALTLLRPRSFDGPFDPIPEMKTTFLRAGHILGAAMIRIESAEHSLLFSGDLGRPRDFLMSPPENVSAVDNLVLESTYGDRLHDRSDIEAQLAGILTRTFARGGVAIVPAFAVGRAQTLLYLIYRLKSTGRIPDVPVYLDSPMATNVTRIYHQHRDDHHLNDVECAQMCGAATMVQSVEQSKWLASRAVPMIIIAGSGMATGGRVVHHIKAFGPEPRNTIIFTGFQAAGTRGAAMLNSEPEIKMHGTYVPIRAEVTMLDGLSAHADYREILQWLSGFKTPPRQVFLTHGEPAAADSLRRRIEETLKWTCHVPEYLDSVSLEV